MIQLANYQTKILKLKYTLYPNYDGDLFPFKDEYDNGMPILKMGTLWKICTKEEYCKLEKYNEEDTKDFIERYCDFNYVAYRKNKKSVYMLVNDLSCFEVLAK